MKSVVYVFVFLLSVATSAVAQTEKGSFLVGGNVNLNAGTTGFSGFSLSLSPQAGIFVANNFAVGTSVPLSFSGQTDYRAYTIGITPFARYYFGKSAARPFVVASVGYTRTGSRLEFDGDVQTGNYGNGQAGVGVGLAYFISEYVGLETVLGYDFYFANGGNGGIVGINVGFQIYLPRGNNE